MLAGTGSDWCDDTTANPFLTSTVLRIKKYAVTMKAVNSKKMIPAKIIPEWRCARVERGGGARVRGGRG